MESGILTAMTVPFAQMILLAERVISTTILRSLTSTKEPINSNSSVIGITEKRKRSLLLI